MSFDRLKRRELIALLGGAAASWPLAARAQQRAIPRVGYVWVGARGTDVSNAGLRQGLADRGYVVGQSILLEERYADGDAERIPALIAQLLALNVDVLVTPGTTISLAAKHMTSTVPIVCVSGNPVGAGLVASLSRPGGNITGLSLLSGDYSSKWLGLLKEMLPQMHIVAVVENPDNPNTQGEMRILRELAGPLGLVLVPLSVRGEDVETSLAKIKAASVDALIVTDDPLIEPLLARLVALTAESRVPALYAFSTAIQQGGLISYSANFFEVWRHTADYVDRILKGARAGDLPIEQATAIALGINLKTAKALGLTIPPPILAAATEVIE
jgi:putative ABC transport system substrate-binding protein